MVKQLGTLAIVVLKAKNLPNKDLWKQDPYCVIRLAGAGKTTQIDRKGGQHPVWDEEFRIDVFESQDKDDRILKVNVFSKQRKIDDLIGEGRIDITEALAKGEFDDWVKLESADKSYCGEVYLEMTYYLSTPPIARRPSKLNPHDRLWRPAGTPPRSNPHTPPSGSPYNHANDLPIAPPPPNQIQSGGSSPPKQTSPIRPPAQLQPGSRDPSPHSRLAVPQQPAAAAQAGLPYIAPAPLISMPSLLRPDGHVKPFVPSQASPVQPQQKPLPQPLPTSLQAGYHSPTKPQPPAPNNAPRNLSPPRHPQLPPRNLEKKHLDVPTQEEADARFASALAFSEGIDIEQLRQEERDAELARKLMEEEEGGHVPGSWH